MEKDECWICKEPSDYNNNSNSMLSYNCSRCGRYSIDLASVTTNRFRGNREIANVSGWVRENQNVQIDQSVFHRLKVTIQHNQTRRV